MGRLNRTRALLRLRATPLDTRLDVAFVCGLAAIAAGCGWIFAPMAPLVGGCLTVGFVWLLQRGISAGEKTPAAETHVVERFVPPDADDELEGF